MGFLKAEDVLGRVIHHHLTFLSYAWKYSKSHWIWHFRMEEYFFIHTVIRLDLPICVSLMI